MKKVLSLVLVLMLTLAMSAMAESAASPVAAPVIPAVADVKVSTDPSVDMYADPSAAAQAEAADQLAKLESEGKEAFFGPAAAAAIDAASNGNLVAVVPFAMTGYDASMGDVTVTITVPAADALTAGQKVAVAVGTPNGVDNGATVYEWEVVEGIANGNGGVEVTFSADLMTKIAAEGALIAIYA